MRHMSFEIEVSDRGVLSITPPEVVMDRGSFLLVIIDALFWVDMDLTVSCLDGRTYITSDNHQLVWPMDGYGYDLIRDLRAGKIVRVMGRPNNEYKEYEWNEVYALQCGLTVYL